jgi:hypothetical protein
MTFLRIRDVFDLAAPQQLLLPRVYKQVLVGTAGSGMQ